MFIYDYKNGTPAGQGKGPISQVFKRLKPTQTFFVISHSGNQKAENEARITLIRWVGNKATITNLEATECDFNKTSQLISIHHTDAMTCTVRRIADYKDAASKHARKIDQHNKLNNQPDLDNQHLAFASDFPEWIARPTRSPS